MRKQIILEHRQALDEYDKARTLHQSCKSTNKCPKDADCVCERALDFKEKQKVYQEKCEALNKLNESALAINQAKTDAKVNERLNRRNEGRTDFKGKKMFEREELTEERFNELTEEGHAIANIAVMYGMSRSSLDYLRKMGFDKNKKERTEYTGAKIYEKESLTREIYDQHKNDGFLEEDISKMYGITLPTLRYMKSKNFENKKGGKSMKYTGKKVYERSKLTVDKYNEHKKDGFSDEKIRVSYGFPKSSFDKWKSDNGLTKKRDNTRNDIEVAATSENLEKDTSVAKKIVDNAIEMKVEPELNLLDLSHENIVLKQENERLNDEIKDLLLKITENNELHSQSLTERYTEMADKNETIRLLSQDNIVLQGEIEGFRIALEQYQEELNKLINNRNQSDEDLTEAINKQFKQFEKYEMMLLGRTLQLLKDKHSA